MPKIERWKHMPEGVRQHLLDRLPDRSINVSDLNRLRLWIDSTPEVPEGDWYKDFAPLTTSRLERCKCLLFRLVPPDAY